ncbi:hypothetical protein BJV74DRAFT_153162 [Russula compacta]|nr:hypothetical protein BJV74DRAFT_153162 [Russula compacta]
MTPKPQAATAIGDSQDTIIDFFERIENFLKRLEVYIDMPPTAGMMDIIVKIMTKLLSVLAIAMKEIRQGKAISSEKFLNKLFGRTGIEDALRRLDKLTQDEVRMAAAESLKAIHGVDDKVVCVGNELQGVSSQVQGVDNRVKGFDGKIDAVIDGGDKIREEMQHIANDVGDQKRNQLRQDLAKWLSPPDPSINYNTASDVHHEGTTVWFTQSSTFKKWKESNSLLWIHGKPGSGKSVLTSVIIHGINGICNAGLGHKAFFFDFKDTGKQDVRALLSSLIVQLSNQSNAFYDILLRFYTTHQSGTQQPSIGGLTQCLENMLRVSGHVPIYLIVDPLDECPNTTRMPSSRDQVLALLEKLVKLNFPSLHLCATSRPEMDIRTSLADLTSPSSRISLHDERGQKEDIIRFVRAVVYSDRNMQRWRDEDRKLVVETLSEGAGGMFRWVYCQLEILRHCLPPSVRSILAELPETLDETYERILQEIPKSNRAHAHRMLQCLTVAVRPLRVNELAEVLAINFTESGGVPTLNENLRWEDQEQAVLSACSSLITVVEDRDSRVVQFSHFSVKEFLTSDRLAVSKLDACHYQYIRPEPAHTIMVQACLGVLLRIDRRNMKDLPLGDYAAKHFHDHAEFGKVLSYLQDGIDYLLDADKPHFAAWLWAREILDWGQPPKAIPLYHVAEFGFCNLVQHLISRRPEDVVAKGGDLGTPLHVATDRGHIDVLRLLLGQCVDVDVWDPNGRTPLHLAAFKGQFQDYSDAN